MDIIGHQQKRQQLKERISGKKPGQAYLFYGPRGVGKSLCALEFAARLVGEPEFTPSADVPHPTDVMIIRPLEETRKKITKRKKIPAETVRAGLRFLSSYPAKGQFRVLIIEDADMLTLSAGNMLLKTLEEPNPTSVLILITGEKGGLLPTLLSRTEKVCFSFVPESIMKEAFHADSRKEDNQALVSFFLSLGRPGLLLRAREDPAFFSQAEGTLGKLFRLSGLSAKERLDFAEELAADVPAASRLLEWWLPGLHSLAFRKVEATGRPQFFRYLEEAERTLFLLRTTQANARLLLEKLFLSVP